MCVCVSDCGSASLIWPYHYRLNKDELDVKVRKAFMYFEVIHQKENGDFEAFLK